MFTDSCKTDYEGTFKNEFIQGTFPDAWQSVDIQVLELYPIFLLVHMFAHKLRNSKVTFHCDNAAVVLSINKQSSRNKLVMTILRPLILLLLKHNVTFFAKHIPGLSNVLCDRLSRFQVTSELLHQQGMRPLPTPVPQRLRPQNFKLNLTTSSSPLSAPLR